MSTPMPAPARRPLPAEPGESYTLRRKVLRILGAAFHVYDREGRLVAFCEQKAFKMREDIRLYRDEGRTQEWLAIRARRVLDFAATYDVVAPDGAPLGSLRRRGLRSTFVRDSWLVFSPDGRELAHLEEEGSALVVLARRYVDFVSLFLPQRFVLRRTDGEPIARFRQHLHLLVYRLGISILRPDPEIDERLVLAAACLLGAIEGRQSSA